MIREYWEDMERSSLSQYAAKSYDSKGRQVPEQKCSIRTEYQRDRDRIIHCRSFRRLKDKTQVFVLAEGDHYRTRLTHTLEVSQISRTIARGLRLNEDLAEAIALGHDLGHTPFGHFGETVLNTLNPAGFKHNEHSLRVVERIERDGKGLNLTSEVRDGILCHRSGMSPSTLEGRVVQISDKIAYINHDIDDSIRAGILSPDDLPDRCIQVLGDTKSKRITRLITDLIHNSTNLAGSIDMSDDVKQALIDLRTFMYANIYNSDSRYNDGFKIHHLLHGIYSFYLSDKERFVQDFPLSIELMRDCSYESAICDYIACMTDNYAIKCFQKLYMPAPWRLTH